MNDARMVGNAADPKQVRRAKRLERHAQERLAADLRSVLDSVQGRRLLWWILEEAGVFRLSFSPGQGSETTSYYEGRRAMGLVLMKTIDAVDPTAYHRMAQEAHLLAQALAPIPDHVVTDKETTHADRDPDTTDDDIIDE